MQKRATTSEGVGLETDDPLAYRARIGPGRSAVVEIATGLALTYRELNELTGRFGGWLETFGSAQKPSRIAYLGRNSIAQIATCLACQRIGFVFVPLNWRLGARELEAIIEDCAPDLILSDAEFLPVLSDVDAPEIVAIEGEEGLLARAAQCSDPAEMRFPCDHPCIMLYTSGTTGKPKGVVITRGNAYASALNFALVGNLTAQSVTLCDLPFFHTIGLVAIARTTLTMGGRLVISDRFLPERSLATLGDPKLGVTHYFAVPQMAVALKSSAHWNPKALTALQAIFIGGAPLSPSLIESFLADGIPLVNGYGMSEAGTALHMPLDRDAVRAHPGSVGYPAPLLDMRLVDDNGEDVDDGAVGEIWLRGPSVTPGYWNKPEETARAFVDGWYRTGDLGRKDASGVYFVPDRLKDMYITGGENVFPAEVEAVIGAHPSVLDVAVIGVPDPKWGETGLAFIVAGKEPPNLDEIVMLCGERLAHYKRPSQFLFVESIPRTASGKAQKHVLRATHAVR